MVEFDVDMGYLLEAGELDSVVLNDENGEHEPMVYVPERTCRDMDGWCSECAKYLMNSGYAYCPHCGAKVTER